jgi:hypothetical protein
MNDIAPNMTFNNTDHPTNSLIEGRSRHIGLLKTLSGAIETIVHSFEVTRSCDITRGYCQYQKNASTLPSSTNPLAKSNVKVHIINYSGELVRDSEGEVIVISDHNTVSYYGTQIRREVS